MSDDKWIIVRNWERFQHPDSTRSDTVIPWLKVYTKLLHNPDFVDLSWSQTGLLLHVWLEFGASDGQLRCSSLTAKAQRRVSLEAVHSLVSAGFISLDASRPPKLSASTEKRREEKKTPLPPYRDKQPKTHSRENGYPEEPAVAAGAQGRPRTKPFNAEDYVRKSGYLLMEEDLTAELQAQGVTVLERKKLLGLASELRSKIPGRAQ